LEKITRLIQPLINEGHDCIQGGGRVRDQRETVAVGFHLYARRRLLTRIMSAFFRQGPLPSLLG